MNHIIHCKLVKCFNLVAIHNESTIITAFFLHISSLHLETVGVHKTHPARVQQQQKKGHEVFILIVTCKQSQVISDLIVLS